MSSAPRAIRAGALLLLPCLGLALWLLRPGHPVSAAALLVCPGWGALRLMSVIDRRFGILGASLCLSVLLLALATLFGSSAHFAPEQLGLTVQIGALALCLLGALRLAAHRRWQAAQPPHPAPMPLWPANAAWCLAVVALALAAAVWANPPSRPAAGSAALFQAAAAESWLRGGEEPLAAGTQQPATRVLACAAAALSAGSGLHPVRAVQLLSLCCLMATLVLCAESVARLRGNRGALPGLLLALLLLDPLGRVLDALPASGTPRIRAALWPFLDGDGRVVALACAALLLCATLSVLRRASFHVPRLAGVAAFGLTLAEPAAAVLLLPGWLLGIGLAHRSCRDSPDNEPSSRNLVRRAGEPRWLRAPFWALAVPIAAGAAGALALTGWPALERQAALPAAGALLLALGAGALLYVPGVRWLNKGPGGEAWFFVGLLALAGPAALLVGLRDGRGADSAARLLALALAVPAATGVLRLLERPGRTWPVLLAVLALVAAAPTVSIVARERHDSHPLAAPVTNGPCAVDPAWIAPDEQAALAGLADRAPDDAVLVPPAGAPAVLLSLLAGRTLLVEPGATPPAGDDGRAALADALVAGDTSLLVPLRGRAGLAARELWTVRPPPCPPGFIEVAVAGAQGLYRAPVPDIVLVTVSGLRPDQLSAAALPRSSPLLARGLRFDEAFTPSPATLPALASLLFGQSPPEHGLLADTGRVHGSALSLPASLSRVGYRAIALVALESDGGLLEGFERAVRAPGAPAGELVEQALSALAEADRRPLFVWLHLGDLQTPTGRASLDAGLSRLLGSVPEASLFILTAPWSKPRPNTTADALSDAVVRVPLVVAGSGLQDTGISRLTALQDVPALILRGVLPDRERVYLSAPPGADGSVRCGLRTLAHKTVLLESAFPPSASTYELSADPDEQAPRPATADELRELLAWRGLAFR